MSSKSKEKYASLDDILVLADMVLPIVNAHIREIVDEAAVKEGSATGTITSSCVDAAAINLLHGAFTLLLAPQLQGEEMDRLDDMLQKATGYMNLAANRVITNIPGNTTKLDSGSGDHVVH